MPTGSNTIFFINRDMVPKDYIPTYGRIVVLERPHKAEKKQTRLTVGNNLSNYPFEVNTPTANMTTSKMLFNSVVFTPEAKFVTTDVSDFYLNTLMSIGKYM